MHQNDGSYLAHTQGRKHQTNLARRAARDEKEREKENAHNGQHGGTIGAGFGGVPKKSFITIGTPQYEMKKILDPLTKQVGLLAHISLPQIAPGVTPHHRWLSAYEQHAETPDNNFMWLVVAAEPYKSVAFKLPRKDVDASSDKTVEFFEPDNKNYWLQVLFKNAQQTRLENVPGLAPGLRR